MHLSLSLSLCHECMNMVVIVSAIIRVIVIVIVTYSGGCMCRITNGNTIIITIGIRNNIVIFMVIVASMIM